jgi:hypothetical protein
MASRSPALALYALGAATVCFIVLVEGAGAGSTPDRVRRDLITRRSE